MNQTQCSSFRPEKVDERSTRKSSLAVDAEEEASPLVKPSNNDTNHEHNNGGAHMYVNGAF